MVSSHSAGTSATTSRSTSSRERRREPRVGLLHGPRDGGQHVAARVERLRDEACDVRWPARPAVVEPERRAVVDRPGAAVPHEEVGVGPGPVDVRRVRVEPQDGGRVGVRRRPGAVVAEGPGKEVDPEVAARTGGQEVLDLLVGLVPGDRAREVDDRQPGGRDAEASGDLADEHLRDEHLAALAGAGELHDVGAEVVGLDEPGEGPALAQRGDVPDGGDGLEHPHRLVGDRRPVAAGYAGPDEHRGATSGRSVRPRRPDRARGHG